MKNITPMIKDREPRRQPSILQQENSTPNYFSAVPEVDKAQGTRTSEYTRTHTRAQTKRTANGERAERKQIWKKRALGHNET